MMMFCGVLFQGFFSYVYKPIGLKEDIDGLDDQFLAMAGASAAVTQTVSRVGFGWLYDKVGFKKIFLTLMAINVLNSILCYPARNNKWVFFLSI